MAKILIGSLGTGQRRDGGYRKATYRLGEKEPISTTFISKALCEFLEIDKLFLVGTRGSIWDSCYLEFEGGDDEIAMDLYTKQEEKNLEAGDLKIVEETIDRFLGKVGSKCFLIEYGLDDTELWANFESYLEILDQIEDGDSVYIDISHAFRSLALMSFLMVQFGHGIRNKRFKIDGIFYGMLEYAHENGNITPIVDLKIFYDLMEWIRAVEAFKRYGRAEFLVQLFENEREIRSQTKETFAMFDTNLSLGNMSALRKFVSNAKRVLPLLERSASPIVRLIAPDIGTFIDRLDKKELYEFQFELARWFYENKNFALSYIVLTESLVSFECKKEGLSETDKTDRDRAKSTLYDGNIAGYKELAGIRNDIAHARESKNSDTKKELKKLEEFFVKIKAYFKEA